MTFQTSELFESQLLGKIPAKWRLDPNRPILKNNIDIVRQSGILSDNELSLIGFDAVILQHQLLDGSRSAVEVLTAYLKASAVAHQGTNCLFDYFPEEALERAKWLDKEYSRTGKPVGPLHGIPISIKESLAIRGHCTNLALLRFVGKNIAQDDCLPVKLLREAGAVFYCKTATPQASSQAETHNFAGRCVNPYNSDLTAGGSSGGEACLMACRGSVLGLATDMAGSIRIPSSACGVYGFKPTAGRIPGGGGNAPDLGDLSVIDGSIGPIARSPRDLDLLYTVLTRANLPLEGVRPDGYRWRGGERPKVGVMWDDGNVRPHPPMQRGLNHLVDKLKTSGRTLVDFPAFKSEVAWNLMSSMIFGDGGETIKRYCEEAGEEVLPLTRWLLEHAKTIISPDELEERRDIFRADFDRHFHRADIDILITPASYGCAPLQGTSRYPHYFSLFNLVNYPAASLPTGLFCKPDLDIREERTDFLSEIDRELYESYEPTRFEGAPIALQVVGGKGKDEEVLDALRLFSDLLS